MGSKLAVTILIGLSCLATSRAAVILNVNGLQASIKNDLVELNFKADTTMASLKVGGQELAPKGIRSFYLDWNSNGQLYFKPSSIHIVEKSDTRVHFYWLQEKIANQFNIEFHYILEDGLPGIYSYVKYRNDGSSTLSLGETRTVYRFISKILDQGTNKERSGTIPTTAELDKCKVVQDTTWLFPNGTYYTKYDYSTYIRKTNYQGVYGHGFGAFLVSPSREYHGGGPLKQDLTVHHESLIANYFLSSHYGTPGIQAPPGWTHVYGPFLLYFPTGSNEEIISKVQQQVETEKAKWPYAFVNDEEYPLSRGSISGNVSGQKSATIVLWDSINEDFDQQQLGYLYTAETDSTGNYNIDNVRPGTYRIAAYPTAGLGSDNLAEGTVTITAGDSFQIPIILDEPQNIIWSLGEANRLSSEFKYSDQPRNYQWMLYPPVNNTFIIGQSDPKEDWYYSQSHNRGHWYIQYQDSNDGRPRILRVALAGSAQTTHLLVFVNGHKVGDLNYRSDSSVSRSAMQSGIYKSNVFTIETEQIVDGENTIEFFNSLGQILYDTISLQRG